ncbi:MAG: ferric reductase-like transmembrane domain-containing protein [Actinomycetota bacterium]
MTVDDQFWWFLARSSGIVAWALLTLGVLCGVLLAARALSGRPTRRWLLDMHRFLGGLGVTFTVVHLSALVADNYVHFDLADLLIPMASEWRPVPVTYGVVAFWLLIAVHLSSLAMRRLPRRAWRTIHVGSYVSFGFATAHGITAGTDLGSIEALAAIWVCVGLVALFFLWRIVVGIRSGRRSRRRRAAARRAPSVATAPPEPTPEPAMAGHGAQPELGLVLPPRPQPPGDRII